MYFQTKFNCTRGNLNCEASAFPGTTHYYVNTDDTIFSSGINNMTDLGYFPPNFGFREGQVQVNDLLFMKGSDGSIWALITEVSPSVMTLIYPNVVPQQNRTIVTTVAGPWASSLPVTLKFVYNGNQVTMTAQNGAVANVTSLTFANFPTGILNVAGITPAIDSLSYPITGVNNGSNTNNIQVELFVNGNMTITNLGTSFTGGALGGFNSFSITYQAT